MIHNAMREVGSPNGFLGHLHNSAQFVLVISQETLLPLAERIINRLTQSLDYFYPIRDRDQAKTWQDRLAIKTGQLPSCKGSAKTATALKEELLRTKN